MSQPLHIVYAVTDDTTAKVRVSRAMPWDAAQNRHQALDFKHRMDDQRKATIGVSGDGLPEQPVRFYCVRSATDPTWPASKARAIPRDKPTGRFI